MTETESRWPWERPAPDEKLDQRILRGIEQILSILSQPPPAPPLTGVWSVTYRGMQFSGRSPMGSSIQEGFGIDFTFQATDALGEPDTTATVALSSDNAAVVTVVDKGSGAGSADVTAGATAGLTANVVATVTDTDGHSVPVSYAIIVLAGDASGGTFTASAQRPTP